MEDAIGESRAGYVTDHMKRELKKIKIMDNREVIFSGGKMYSTHYVRNNADRNRYNNWKKSIH